MSSVPATRNGNVVLMNTVGHGHLNPMLAFSESLAREGWRVQFFAGREDRPQIERTGATFCNYGSDDWELFAAMRRVAERLEVEPDRELSEQMMPYAVVPATLDVLPHLIQRLAELKPAFVVYDAACPWGWVVTKFMGIPAVCSMTALPIPLKELATASATEWSSTRVLDATVSAIRAAYGVDLNHNFSYANYAMYNIMWTSRAWHRGNEEFARDKFHYWGSIASKRGTSGGGKTGDCVHQVLCELGQRKLVFVSLGTVVTGPLFATFGSSIEDLYRKMCAAAASMPEVSFIFALGSSMPAKFAEDGRAVELFDGIPVPPNATAVAMVDQLKVLERASVFVTHCGMNSSSEAVANHVPVVAVPFFGDQIYNASIFENLGCGLLQRYTEGFHARLQWKPDHSRITEASLGTAIRRVLEEPQFLNAVHDVRARELEECGQPLSEKLAHLLEYVCAQQAADGTKP